MIEIIKKYIKNNDEILEISYRESSFINNIKHWNSNVHLFNIETNNYKKYRTTTKGSLKQELPYYDKQFDVIYFNNFIEKLFPEQLYNFLVESDRVLKNNGYIIINSIMRGEKFKNDMFNIKSYHPQSIINYLTIDKLQQTSKNKISNVYSVEKLIYNYNLLQEKNKKIKKPTIKNIIRFFYYNFKEKILKYKKNNSYILILKKNYFGSKKFNEFKVKPNIKIIKPSNLKKDDIKISIIIPVKKDNNPDIAINSIKKQRFKNYQIIIVNDIYKKGSNWARNEGFKFANTKYTLFSDDDLSWKENSITYLYNILEKNPKKSYAYGNYILNSNFKKNYKFSKKRLKKMNYIPTSALIRTEDFLRFDKDIKRFQDWDLWLTMLKNDLTGIYINKTIFETYYHIDGISQGDYSDDLKKIIKKHSLDVKKIKY
jgi:predicted SAM-dependent methyltransferase